MKKYFAIFIFTAFACSGVFAESPFSVTIDTVVDAFYIRSFNGDYSSKKPAIAGSPYKYQGDYDIKSFQSSAFDDGVNGRLQLAYSGEKLGGLLQFRANTDTGVLDNWDWEAWLRLGKFFKVTAGNQGQRGQVERYQNFDDFLKTKVDSFGVLYPTWQKNPPFSRGNNFDTKESFPWGYDAPGQNKGFAKFASTDTNDLFTPAGSMLRQPLGFLLDATFAPVTVSASVGGLFSSVIRPFNNPWLVGQKERAIDYDDIYDPVLTNKTNFGVRVEGAKIVDLLTVAAVYKYADALLNKPTAQNARDTIEEKVGNHTFGLYANITPLDGLGISIGYSGLFQTWENPRFKDTLIDPTFIDYKDADSHYLSAYKEVDFPYYSGIDLRASYTGIEKLAITFNNNASFASVKGTDNRDEKYAHSWVYYGELNENATGVADRTEKYFGLYNALGVQYAIAKPLIVDIQVANQLGIFSLDWQNDAAASITDTLGLYAGVTYTVIEKDKIHASIRGGVDVYLNSFSYQNPVTVDVHQAGYIDFGIPVGIKVEF